MHVHGGHRRTWRGRANLEQLLYNLKIEKKRITNSWWNILNCWIFWEQLDSAIHGKPQLTDNDKLTYLREALKGGPARNVIESLTQTSESYNEAIRCLQKCYDWPCVLLQVHVQKIQETSPLKTGSGQELHQLHDHLQQYIRVLKVSREYLQHGDLSNCGHWVKVRWGYEIEMDRAQQQLWDNASVQGITRILGCTSTTSRERCT